MSPVTEVKLICTSAGFGEPSMYHPDEEIETLPTPQMLPQHPSSQFPPTVPPKLTIIPTSSTRISFGLFFICYVNGIIEH